MSDASKPNSTLLIAGAAIVAVVILAVAVGGSANKAEDPENLNARILPVARVSMAGAGGGAVAGSRSGEQLFQSACNACHGTGAMGAPKVGANADWAPRLTKGLNGLVKSAVAGIRAMPPKGGVADATDTEIARAIVYMANKSGGSLKAPK